MKKLSLIVLVFMWSSVYAQAFSGRVMSRDTAYPWIDGPIFLLCYSEDIQAPVYYTYYADIDGNFRIRLPENRSLKGLSMLVKSPGYKDVSLRLDSIPDPFIILMDTMKTISFGGTYLYNDDQVIQFIKAPTYCIDSLADLMEKRRFEYDRQTYQEELHRVDSINQAEKKRYADYVARRDSLYKLYGDNARFIYEDVPGIVELMAPVPPPDIIMDCRPMMPENGFADWGKALFLQLKKNTRQLKNRSFSLVLSLDCRRIKSKVADVSVEGLPAGISRKLKQALQAMDSSWLPAFMNGRYNCIMPRVFTRFNFRKM